MNERASLMVNRLKSLYHADRFKFDFNICMSISGNENKKLRQMIIQIVTGKLIPIAKCGIGYVSNCLKAYYETPQLF